ncbi:unnamed protein product, partial [Allacma fusca]
IEM